MRRNYIFGWLIFFIFYMHFEGFLKLYFGYHPVIHGLKYIFASVFIFLIIRYPAKFRTPLTVPIIFFAAFVLVQLFNPIMWQGKGYLLSILGAYYYLGYVPLFFIGYSLLDKKQVYALMYFIISLATLSSLFAYFQYSLGVPEFMEFMPYEPTAWVKQHIYGPNAFSLIPPDYWYLTGLIFCLYFYFKEKKRFLFFVLGSNLIVSIIISNLRAGIVVTLFTLLVFFLMRLQQVFRIKHIKKIITMFVVALFVFLFFYSSVWDKYTINRYKAISNPVEGYISTRGFTWTKCLPQIITTYPFGSGLRHAEIIPAEKFGVEPLEVYTGDNYFNIILAELGVPGFIAFLFLLYFVLATIFKRYLDSPNKEERLLIAALGSLILGFLAISITGNPTGWMLWLFLGILVRSEDFKGPDSDEPNEAINESGFFSFMVKLFRGSIFSRIFKKENFQLFYDFISKSKFAAFMELSLKQIKSSKFYKISKKILD